MYLFFVPERHDQKPHEKPIYNIQFEQGLNESVWETFLKNRCYALIQDKQATLSTAYILSYVYSVVSPVSAIVLYVADT